MPSGGKLAVRVIGIRHVVCATDIERPSRAALRYSFFISECFDASMHVLHAWAPLGQPESGAYVAKDQRIEQLMGQQRLHERLEAVVRAAAIGAGGRATTHILDGNLVPAIVTYAGRHRSDLIVLGTELHSEPVSDDAPDTVASRMGRAATCPVLTVPDARVSRTLQVRRVLVPLDPSSTLDSIIPWVAMIARRFDAVVELLHASEHAGTGSEDATQAPVRAAADALRVSGVAVERARSNSNTSVSAGTLQRIEEGNCDLIMMASLPRGERGGAADAVAEVRRQSFLPVLSVPGVALRRLFVDGGLEREHSLHSAPPPGADFVRDERGDE